MISITWADPRCVQELTTILGPQNRTQGSCELESSGKDHSRSRSIQDFKTFLNIFILPHFVIPGWQKDIV